MMKFFIPIVMFIGSVLSIPSSWASVQDAAAARAASPLSLPDGNISVDRVIFRIMFRVVAEEAIMNHEEAATVLSGVKKTQDRGRLYQMFDGIIFKKPTDPKSFANEFNAKFPQGQTDTFNRFCDLALAKVHEKRRFSEETFFHVDIVTENKHLVDRVEVNRIMAIQNFQEKSSLMAALQDLTRQKHERLGSSLSALANIASAREFISPPRNPRQLTQQSHDKTDEFEDFFTFFYQPHESEKVYLQMLSIFALRYRPSYTQHCREIACLNQACVRIAEEGRRERERLQALIALLNDFPQRRSEDSVQASSKEGNDDEVVTPQSSTMVDVAPTGKAAVLDAGSTSDEGGGSVDQGDVKLSSEIAEAFAKMVGARSALKASSSDVSRVDKKKKLLDDCVNRLMDHSTRIIEEKYFSKFLVLAKDAIPDFSCRLSWRNGFHLTRGAHSYTVHKSQIGSSTGLSEFRGFLRDAGFVVGDEG